MHVTHTKINGVFIDYDNNNFSRISFILSVRKSESTR